MPFAAATTVIELRMMAAATVMFFPRMVDDEDGIIAPATPTMSTAHSHTRGNRRRSAIVIAATRTAGDHSKQYDRSDRSGPG